VSMEVKPLLMGFFILFLCSTSYLQDCGKITCSCPEPDISVFMKDVSWKNAIPETLRNAEGTLYRFPGSLSKSVNVELFDRNNNKTIDSVVLLLPMPYNNMAPWAKSEEILRLFANLFFADAPLADLCRKWVSSKVKSIIVLSEEFRRGVNPENRKVSRTARESAPVTFKEKTPLEKDFSPPCDVLSTGCLKKLGAVGQYDGENLTIGLFCSAVRIDKAMFEKAVRDSIAKQDSLLKAEQAKAKQDIIAKQNSLFRANQDRVFQERLMNRLSKDKLDTLEQDCSKIVCLCPEPAPSVFMKGVSWGNAVPETLRNAEGTLYRFTGSLSKSVNVELFDRNSDQTIDSVVLLLPMPYNDMAQWVKSEENLRLFANLFFSDTALADFCSKWVTNKVKSIIMLSEEFRRGVNPENRKVSYTAHESAPGTLKEKASLEKDFSPPCDVLTSGCNKKLGAIGRYDGINLKIGLFCSAVRIDKVKLKNAVQDSIAQKDSLFRTEQDRVFQERLAKARQDSIAKAKQDSLEKDSAYIAMRKEKERLIRETACGLSNGLYISHWNKCLEVIRAKPVTFSLTSRSSVYKTVYGITGTLKDAFSNVTYDMEVEFSSPGKVVQYSFLPPKSVTIHILDAPNIQVFPTENFLIELFRMAGLDRKPILYPHDETTIIKFSR
jgi:hypothetical protein